MIIVDTGVFVAWADSGDKYHDAAVSVIRNAKVVGEQLALTPMVLAECCYLINEAGGAVSEAAFIEDVADGVFTLLSLDNHDLIRIADLVRKFAGFPLGGSDASSAVAADRYGTKKIATFDRRHFPALSPESGGHFDLLPSTL